VIQQVGLVALLFLNARESVQEVISSSALVLSGRQLRALHFSLFLTNTVQLCHHLNRVGPSFDKPLSTGQAKAYFEKYTLVLSGQYMDSELHAARSLVKSTDVSAPLRASLYVNGLVLMW